MTPDPKDALIVALDAAPDEAVRLADSLAGTVRWLKVGMTLFYESGPGIVFALRERGFDVFLDLKLHDIPHQVEGAARSIARLGVQMTTVHASGGNDMVARAVEGALKGAEDAGVPAPAVIAVTVLTSMDADMLARTGVARMPDVQAGLLADLATGAGADGIVCSPQEAGDLSALLGHDKLIVTPGVRPVWAAANDQARIATPAQALGAGATHLVVGRPITADADPAAAASRILDEMRGN